MVQMLNEKPKLQQLTIKPFKRCECEMRPFEEWMNQMNISKTAAMYIVEKDTKSGITTWMYIPEEKKEKDMKETNLQHYKEELKKIYNEDYEYPSIIHDKIRMKIDESVESNNYTKSLTDDILDWMAKPFKGPILNDTEREYLAAVIRPFKENACTVCKKYIQSCSGLSYEYIVVKLNTERWGFPKFVEGTMYKNMELDKEYSLEELGL